jgi:hypothetical protein
LGKWALKWICCEKCFGLSCLMYLDCSQFSNSEALIRTFAMLRWQCWDPVNSPIVWWINLTFFCTKIRVLLSCDSVIVWSAGIPSLFVIAQSFWNVGLCSTRLLISFTIWRCFYNRVWEFYVFFSYNCVGGVIILFVILLWEICVGPKVSTQLCWFRCLTRGRVGILGSCLTELKNELCGQEA